jgi:hypothetical protein
VATPRTIALIYCLYASLAVLLLATTIPPMQNPDEAAHTYRADQVGRLGLLGQVIADGEFGGVVSSGIALPAAATLALHAHPERKLSRAMLAPSAWGPPVEAGFPNTAINPPFFYIPAAAADAGARALGKHLPNALILMRIATGFTTIAVAAAAISLAGDAALWLFAVLLLPMSLAVSAAISQDGPMLASAAMAVALYLRLRAHNPAHLKLTFACLCLLLTLLGMARSPYLAFALLAIAAPVKRSWRIIGVAVIFACVLAWTARSAAHLPLPSRTDGPVSPWLQFMALITHPWRFPILVFRTLRANEGFIVRGFIGQLGWLDTDLPHLYHVIAWLGLGVAALAAWRPRPAPILPAVIGLEALAVIGSAGGLCLVQYMIWTNLGNPLIDGVQGRYFLAPALCAGVLLSGGAPARSRAQSWLTAPVLALPVLGIAVTMHALIARYYY